MKVEFQVIEDSSQVKERSLQDRIDQLTKGQSSTLYLVKGSDAELAFVVLDDLKDIETHNILFIYELYVVPSQRGHGIGTQILRDIEALAVEGKYTRLVLRPAKIDSDWSKEKLIYYYHKRGYKEYGEFGEMEKVLKSTAEV